MASQLPAVCTPLFPSTPSKIGQTQGVVVVCVSMSLCVFVCPTPLWPLSWTRTLPAQREIADCGNDRAVLQCTGLNVKLIFNVWHFTQIIRPQTWPWGIPQIAFSVPQQLWNYSSQRERERERGGEKKPLSLAKWSPSHCSGHPRLEALALSLFSVISWSQGRAKLKTSWQSGGCMK